MTLLYRAMIEWPGAVVLVVDDPGGPIGFVAGVTDTGGFYRHFVRRYGLRAALSALPRLILNLRRAWESLRYGSEVGEEEGPSAELLAIAIAERARGRGLSTILGTEFLQRLTDAGCEEVKVVVAEQNATAIGAYHKLGFEHFVKTEVHRGEVSEVMVWRA
jgi:ribosomal protein S18 acetylase RimI-like enzyme